MSTLKQFVCGAAALLGAISVSHAQLVSSAPAVVTTVPAAPAPAPALEATSPSAALPKAPGASSVLDDNSMMLVQAVPATATPAPVLGETTTTTTTMDSAEPLPDADGVGVREFQGDDVGQVLRLLARQAKINMVVSDQIPPGTTVTMRLEDVTALQAIAIIVKAKGLFMDRADNVYYIKTPRRAHRRADRERQLPVQLFACGRNRPAARGAVAEQGSAADR
ncbi:hypothetical protein BH20VER1_BH20VER1_10370 [soil metagenome]